MRHLPLFLLLFLSSFLSAQCFISVSFLESECVDDGNSFIVNFTVQGEGTEDATWTSPTLGVSGAYNTGDVFSAGPFANDAFETILFQDSDIAACFNVYDTPLPDCPAPGCENFAMTAFADDVTFCESGEVWSFNQTGGQFPIVLRITNEFGELVQQQFFETPEGISIFIDEGVYNVVMTDEFGCRASTVIEVAAHNCSSIVGFSWLDRNVNGVQDENEQGVTSVLFELLDINGDVVDTMTSNFNGLYFFNNIIPGTYSVRAIPPSWLISSTIVNAGDDCTDSDFDRSTLTTRSFTLVDGERKTCIDAGWSAGGRVSGFSWRDDNGDGFRTAGEPPVASAVELLLDGQLIASSGTNVSGFYSFDGISSGTGYAVRFAPPVSRTPITPGAADGQLCFDSDIDVNTFTTEAFEITSGENVSCIDAGWESQPCETFEVGIFREGDEQPLCSPDVFIFVNLGRLVEFPVFVEIVDTATQTVTRLDTLRSRNGGFYDDLPSGVYRFTLTNEADCSFSEVINAVRGEGCGYFLGNSWRDDNENGILDEVNSSLSARVELLRNGVVVSETTTNWNGFYSFWGVGIGDYQIRFVEPSGFMPTIKDANGGFNDSAADPVTGLTDILTVPPGGVTDTINVGWVRTVECSEFQLNVEIDHDNLVCTSLGEYVASVEVASYPLEFVLMNSFSRDTLERVTLTEPGDARFFITVQGNYIIAVQDASGCSDEYNFRALQSVRVSGDIRQTGTSCTSDSIPTLSFISFSTSQNLNYLWSNGETGQSITNLTIGENYWVTVTDELANCSNVWARTVRSIMTSGLATVSFPNPFVIGCEQDSVLIQPDTILEGFTYRWFGPLNTIYDGPSFYATFAGTFALEAFNENGCSISGRAQVENQSLENQFIELFEWSQDSICNDVTCFGLESSVNFGENSPFNILWEGPTEQFNEFANSVGNSSNFCGFGPGLYRVTVTSDCDTVRRSLFIEDPTECSSISGTLWVDQGADCGLDPEDTRVPRYVVTLTNQDSGEMFYAMTDMAGNWTANVPLGVYEIEPTLDPFSPFGVCPPQVVTLSDFPITGIQLFLPAENACAQLTTTVTMPFLRRCFSNQAYVQYENRGSATAVDAELVVVLDDFFANVTANRPFVSRDGNTFTFDLGDLEPFEVGTIRFNFVVSCEASIGQAHCIEANIKPDEPCNPDENWGGALVQVDAIGCDGDSVRFDISNIGLEQMSVALTYIIIEDGIMLSPDPFTNGLLLPMESMLISLPSNGSTYQVVTNQEPNAPANDDPTGVVEGCNAGSGGNSTGFTNILPLNNGALTSTTVCRENVGAYDPNDKTGYPLGFGDNNGIMAGTRLDYAIRFQNTGTDTAFTVVIRDTLPHELDLATLKLDAASHEFVATLDSNRVLTLVFENILLPDSTTNLAGSQGVVQFSIDHDSRLLPGSIIRNEAAIYFDFNEPIITNKTRHVITKDGLPVSTRTELARQVSLKVYPNPTDGVLNVNIPLADVGQQDQLQVTDLYGRTLAATTYAQASAGWNLSHLPAGYYLVVVTDATGRAKGRTGFVVAK